MLSHGLRLADALTCATASELQATLFTANVKRFSAVEGRSKRQDLVPAPCERSPRELVLDEFHAAIAGRKPALHDGRWGPANLELCITAIESSRSGQEVRLHEQVATSRGVTRLDTHRPAP